MLIYTGCKHILSPLALSQLPSAIVDATHLSLDIARRDYRARSAVPLRSEPVAALLRARCNTLQTYHAPPYSRTSVPRKYPHTSRKNLPR